MKVWKPSLKCVLDFTSFIPAGVEQSVELEQKYLLIFAAGLTIML